MLFHEALARSRQREAEEAARCYHLVAGAIAADRRSRRPLLGAVFRRIARGRTVAARRAAVRRVVS